MTAFFYKNIPEYQLKRFVAVRDAYDNLLNLLNLVEIINTCSHCKLEKFEEDFDLAIFSGEYCRTIIRKDDGFFSMAIPFQIIETSEAIFFNLDAFGEEVSGQFISIIRNAVQTSRNDVFSNEDIILSLSENFNLELQDAILYYDAFIYLIAEDHGYFRFDDDLKHENGNFHPRYHLDFFCKNTSSVKIGLDNPAGIDCFYALMDSKHHKHYLRA
jgi:hypothetical protein